LHKGKASDKGARLVEGHALGEGDALGNRKDLIANPILLKSLETAGQKGCPRLIEILEISI